MTILKRFTKLTSIVLVVFIACYVANYYRLSVLPPAQIDYVQAVEANTVHLYGSNILKAPTSVDLGQAWEWTKIDWEPYQGTHYVNLWRFFFGKFDLNKPPITVYENQHLVGYVYTTDKPFGNYHWHKHNNICYLDGMVGTTEFSPFWCVSHGYLYWPFSKWHLHVWLDGIGGNDLWHLM